jgi:hypothetical protein
MPWRFKPATLPDFIAGYVSRARGGYAYYAMSFIAQNTEGLGPNNDGEDWECPSPTWKNFSDGLEGASLFGNFHGSTTRSLNSCYSPDTKANTGSVVSIPLSENSYYYSTAFAQVSMSPPTENTHWSAYFSRISGGSTIYLMGETNRGFTPAVACNLTSTPTVCGISSLGGRFTNVYVGCVGQPGPYVPSTHYSVPCEATSFCVSDQQVHQGTSRRTFIRNAAGSPSYALPAPRLMWGTQLGPPITTTNTSASVCRRGNPYNFSSIQPGDYVWYTQGWPRITGSATGAPKIHAEGGVSMSLSCTDNLTNGSHWGALVDGGAVAPTIVDGGNPLIAGAFAPDPFGGGQATHFSFPATSGLESSMWRNTSGSCSSATNCTSSIHLWTTDGGTGTLDLCAVNNSTVFGCKACPYSSSAINRCYLNTVGTTQWLAFGNASRFMDGGARPAQTVIVSHPQMEPASFFGAYPTSYTPTFNCSSSVRSADDLSLGFDAGLSGSMQDAGCVALTLTAGTTAADSAPSNVAYAMFNPGGTNRTPINRIGTQLNLGGATTTISTCSTTACWNQGVPARFVARWQPGIQSIRTGQGQVDGGSTGLAATITPTLRVAAPGLISDIQMSPNPKECTW